MRRALLSVAVALTTIVCVTASGWALQAAALPAPRPATRLAADASAWLHEYRFAIDVFHRDHRRSKGACLRGWFGRPHLPKTRASLLSLGTGRPLLMSGQHPWLAADSGSDQPGRILAFVGCTDELASVLGAAAQSGGGLTAERGYAANQPAIALEVRHGDAERLTLYVSPPSYRPLVAFASVRGLQATARIYLTGVQPGVLKRFRFPRDGPRSRR